MSHPDDDEPSHRGAQKRPRLRDELQDYDAAGNPIESLVPYRNPLALASYYCGIFSIICVFGLILGPAALVFGILGYREAMQAQKMKGAGHAMTGIVLGSLTAMLNWGVLHTLAAFAFFYRN